MSRPREMAPIVAVRIERDQVVELFAQLEPTEDVVWLSRSCRCQRATLRGVPAKRIDILVDARLADLDALDPRDAVVVEVGRKAGRYDGAVRDRVAVRVMHAHDAARRPAGRLDIEMSPERANVSLSDGTGIQWEATYARFRSDLDGYSGGRLVWWHARRYYGFLVETAADDVRALAAEWDALPLGELYASLAEANRAASRALYQLGRSAGWHKLTLRERTRLDLHSEAQWTSEEIYSRAQAALLDDHPAVGHATERAAARSGLGLVFDEIEIYKRTES